MAHVIPELDKKGLRQFGLMAGGFVIGIFGLLFPWLKECGNSSYGPGSLALFLLPGL